MTFRHHDPRWGRLIETAEVSGGLVKSPKADFREAMRQERQEVYPGLWDPQAGRLAQAS